MNSICCNQPSRFGGRDIALGQDSGLMAKSLRVSTSRESKTDLTIITAEGDKVTLSAQSSIEADYTTYRAALVMKGMSGEVSGETLAIEIEQGIQISVEGDLNDQELEALSEAIQTVYGMMKDLLSGDNSSALAQAETLEGLAPIASIQGSATFIQSLQVEQQTVTGKTIPAQFPDKDGQPSLGEGTSSDPVEKETDKIIDVIKKSGFHPRAFRRPLKGMFRYLLGRHDKGQGMEAGKRALSDRFRSRLMDRIAEMEQKKGAAENADTEMSMRPFVENLKEETKALPPSGRSRVVGDIRGSFFQ